MGLKNTYRKFLLIPICITIFLLVRYLYLSLTLISAFGAKALCSSVFLQYRSADMVIKNDLSGFPFSLATYEVNAIDSSVSVNVFGLAESKAIYRKGMGATLINDFMEAEVRSQHFNIPTPLPLSDSINWPLGTKIKTSVLPTSYTQKLDSILNQEINGNPGKPTHTRAIAVVYNGELIAEQYATGFSASTVMPAWSATKSITGLLIGILVKQGKLHIDSTANIPQWAGTPKQPITIKQLLQQTSGLNYTENYLYPSEAATMLFRRGNMAAYAEGLPLKYPPGTVFNYSSGNSNILGDIIKKTIDKDAYAAFPYTALLYKIGMYSAILEPDASGMYVGSSYCYATARDFARFGLLCLNNGKWNNEQILPDNWIAFSTQPVSADKLKRYGAQFWLNGYAKSNTDKHQFADVPGDMYYAAGYGGQGIFIIPSKKTVIVRLGLEKTNENKLLADILSVLPSTTEQKN